MLAEIGQEVSYADPAGVFCLASILFIALSIFLYMRTGWIAGSTSCLIIFAFFVWALEGETTSNAPTWLFHPASPCFIFGFFSIPAIAIIGMVMNFCGKK